MLDLDHIGERIRECRKKKMMTIRVLGEYTGLSAGYLSMLEQNKTSPNVDSLARICAYWILISSMHWKAKCRERRLYAEKK